MSNPILGGGTQEVREICKVLGLEAGKCAGIRIIIEPDDVIHAEVKLFIHDDQLGELTDIWRRYEWVEVAEDEPDPA